MHLRPRAGGRNRRRRRVSSSKARTARRSRSGLLTRQCGARPRTGVVARSRALCGALTAAIASVGGGTSRRPWRREVRRAGAHRRRRAGGTRRARPAGAAAPAAQPRGHPRRGRPAPQLPQVACFDTAFHRTQPEVAQRFGLPRRFTDEGIRRYGFHGLSYEYIASVLSEHRSPGGGGQDGRRAPRQRRQPVRDARRQQRRHHDELHARRTGC